MVEQVRIPHSVVSGKAPLPQELDIAGLAVNLKDYTLFTKGYDGVIIRLTGVTTVTDDNETNDTVFLSWVKEIKAGVGLYVSSSKLRFNPSTGRLSAQVFAGSGAELTDFTGDQIVDALGYEPAQAISGSLAPPASDLDTAIALANSLRNALIQSGIGSS